MNPAPLGNSVSISATGGLIIAQFGLADGTVSAIGSSECARCIKVK
jgi:hypothetical protein